MRIDVPDLTRSSKDAVTGIPSPLHGRLQSAVRLCTAALMVFAVSGCATTDPRDPLEPLNRGIYEFNDAIDRGVVKPVAQAYIAVVPQTGRTGVSNFFGNIYDVWNVINNALQGKVSTAFSDLGRIALNTTVGLLGVVDVASRVGLDKSDEDLGQTLGWWGIGHGPYLVLPFLGPSSVRDGVGTLTQIYFDPIFQIDDATTQWSLAGLRLISLRADLLGAGAVLDTAASDRYAFLRDAYFQRRRSQLWDGNPPRLKDGVSRRQMPAPGVQPSIVELPSVWRLPASQEPPAQPGQDAASDDASAPPLQTSARLN